MYERPSSPHKYNHPISKDTWRSIYSSLRSIVPHPAVSDSVPLPPDVCQSHVLIAHHCMCFRYFRASINSQGNLSLSLSPVSASLCHCLLMPILSTSSSSSPPSPITFLGRRSHRFLKIPFLPLLQL